MERFVKVKRLYRRYGMSECETENKQPCYDWYKGYPHLLDLEDVLYIERSQIADKDIAIVCYKSINEGCIVDMPYLDAERLFLQYKKETSNFIAITKHN
jgi:hypothetical protein